VDPERWTRRFILAGYVVSLLTIVLGMVLGGLVVLALLLVFARF